jgi:hypothetical protein
LLEFDSGSEADDVTKELAATLAVQRNARDLSDVKGLAAYTLAADPDDPTTSIATHRITGAVRVVKSFRLPRGAGRDALREVGRTLLALDTDEVARVYEVCEDYRHIRLLMEQCTGEDPLQRVLSRSNIFEQEAAVLVRHMLMSLCRLHQAGLAHGSLRPDSFRFADARPQSTLKLVDMGLEARCAGWDSQELLALQELCSIVFFHGDAVPRGSGDPEGSRAQAASAEPRTARDMWSIGCIAYLLMCGYPPFFSPTKRGAIARTRSWDFHFDMPYWAKVSDEAKSFVRACLSSTDVARLSCEEALQHPWIVHLADAAPMGPLLPSFMVNLRRFYRMTCIERYLASVFADSLPAETQQLRKALQVADSRNVGWLSASALEAFFRGEGHTEVADLFAKHFVVPEHEGEAYVDYNCVLTNARILRCRKLDDAIWEAFDAPGGKRYASEVPTILKHKDVEQACVAGALPYAQVCFAATTKATHIQPGGMVDIHLVYQWVHEAIPESLF